MVYSSQVASATSAGTQKISINETVNYLNSFLIEDFDFSKYANINIFTEAVNKDAINDKISKAKTAIAQALDKIVIKIQQLIRYIRDKVIKELLVTANKKADKILETGIEDFRFYGQEKDFTVLNLKFFKSILDTTNNAISRGDKMEDQADEVRAQYKEWDSVLSQMVEGNFTGTDEKILDTASRKGYLIYISNSDELSKTIKSYRDSDMQDFNDSVKILNGQLKFAQKAKRDASNQAYDANSLGVKTELFQKQVNCIDRAISAYIKSYNHMLAVANRHLVKKEEEKESK